MALLLKDIETAIEVVRKVMKQRRWEDKAYQACKKTLEELWIEHSRISEKLKEKYGPKK